MIRTRITTALLVLEIACAIFLFGSAISRAYDTSQLTGSTGSNLNVNSIIQNSGLNSSQYAACTGDILSLFNSNLGNRVQQVVQNTAQQLLQQLITQKATSALCDLRDFLNADTIGAASIAIRILGFNQQCTTTENSIDATQALQQLQDNLRSNFLAGCMSAEQLHVIEGTVTDIVQNEGPGGLAAYAVDWIKSAFTEPDRLAYRRFWTELVHTNICPYMKAYVLSYPDFKLPMAYRTNPPVLNGVSLAVNADEPFTSRGACTLPDGYDPGLSMTATSFIAGGGFSGLALLSEPQNNPQDFIQMATEELQAQRVAMAIAAAQQLVAGGGFLPSYGTNASNCLRAPDGNGCIAYGNIAQPPGAVRDIVNSDLNKQWDQITNATGDNPLLNDVAAAIRVRLLDLANAPLPLNLEISNAQNPYNFTPSPSPSPSSAVNPNDPVCTGGDSRCTCVEGNSTYTGMAQQVIVPAITSVRQAHPELFVNGTSQIAPGVNFRTILTDVCGLVGGASICHPHPSQDDTIVLDLGAGISFRIITPDGFVSTTGGDPIASCQTGVQ